MDEAEIWMILYIVKDREHPETGATQEPVISTVWVGVRPPTQKEWDHAGGRDNNRKQRWKGGAGRSDGKGDNMNDGWWWCGHYGVPGIVHPYIEVGEDEELTLQRDSEGNRVLNPDYPLKGLGGFWYLR